jgi:hypothetical protein
MQGLTEVLTALSGWITGAFEALQQGVIGVDTVKEVALTIVRRARLGSAVEDAIENIQAPASPTPTEQEMQELGVTRDKIVGLLQTEADKRSGSDAATEQFAQRIDQHEQVLQLIGQTVQGMAQARPAARRGSRRTLLAHAIGPWVERSFAAMRASRRCVRRRSRSNHYTPCPWNAHGYANSSSAWRRSMTSTMTRRSRTPLLVSASCTTRATTRTCGTRIMRSHPGCANWDARHTVRPLARAGESATNNRHTTHGW